MFFLLHFKKPKHIYRNFKCKDAHYNNLCLKDKKNHCQNTLFALLFSVKNENEKKLFLFTQQTSQGSISKSVQRVTMITRPYMGPHKILLKSSQSSHLFIQRRCEL